MFPRFLIELDEVWQFLLAVAEVAALAGGLAHVTLRQRDARAASFWAVIIIFVPLLSALVYLISYHEGIADRSGRGAAPDQLLLDQRVDETVATSGPAGVACASASRIPTCCARSCARCCVPRRSASCA